MSIARNPSDKYKKKLLDTVTKTGVDALKTVQKVVCKAAEATGESIGNKIANKIVKLKPVPDVNSKIVDEIVIPPEKRLEILRYYTTFKMRRFKWLFYKVNTFLQKTTTCIGLQAEQIFSVNI